MREDPCVFEAAPVFYFAAMSPYSWLAAERVERELPQARWRPVTAAFVFRAAGRTSWGFTDQRAAGIADCERRAAEHGLGPISWPDPWPTNDLPIARAMTFADARGELRPFALGAMRMAFREGRDLAELDAVLEAGERAGIAPAELETAVGDAAVKDALRAVTDEATGRGVFGIPTVLVGEQLFWGDDRLADAAAAWRTVAAASRPVG
jgi:2-hydroxychromene-2-carboxylate isomerase